MSAVNKGGCLCGDIRYEVTADPAMAGHCHCTDCQKYSGGGHISIMAVPDAGFALKGDVASFDKTADSGNTITRHFCAKCGAHVHNTNTGMPGLTFVSVGTLDDPSVFEPQMVVYASRAHAWDKQPSDLAHFPAMPPMGE